MMGFEADMHHITTPSEGRLTLFEDEATIRRCVHALAAQLRDCGLLFALVDDHFHYVVNASRPEAGAVARRVSQAIGRLTGRRLAPAFIRPVESRRHILRLVGYLSDQCRHHNLSAHPATYSGSSFLDLVGARLCAFPRHLLQRFPRLRASDLCAAVGVASPEKVGRLDQLQGLAPGRLVELTESVFAYAGTRSKQPQVARRVRHLVARLGRELGHDAADLAAALGVSGRSIRRYAGTEPAAKARANGEPPAAWRAVLIRHHLEQEVERQAEQMAVDE